MEDKPLDIELFSEGQVYVLKRIYINLNSINKIIGTTLNEIFHRDEKIREIRSLVKSTPILIKYNKITNLVIRYDDILILDTREEKYKQFQALLKFNNSDKSKRRFAKLIYYLSLINQSDLVIESISNEQNKEINYLLRFGNKDSADDALKYSDYQLALLCKGMLESAPREIARRYFQNGHLLQSDREQAVSYVSQAKLKYGEAFLDYCLELPQKPVHISDVRLVFAQFEKGKDFTKPILRVMLDNNTEVELVYRNKSSIEMRRNENVLATLNRNGNIICTKSDRNLTSTIYLFYRLSSDPLSEILYFGGMTGKCSFCGLPLDNPISLRYGYGKTCADNNQLPWM